MDELSPAIELAIDYGRQLRAIQPDHELLKYLAEGKDPKLDAEFEERFWNKPFPMEGQPGHLVNATIWANYAVALRDTAAAPQYLADFLVAELGGLLVIGTERHESRRIDDQLIGRFYRQQWLRVTFNGHAVQIRLQGRIVKFAVVTNTHRGAMISVKRVS